MTKPADETTEQDVFDACEAALQFPKGSPESVAAVEGPDGLRERYDRYVATTGENA